MKQLVKTLTSAAASTNGLAAGVTGATFTLSANDAGDSLGHLITVKNNTITSHTGQNITITGLDEHGQPQSETITGPAGSATVTSTKYFSSVTSIQPSATIGADTFDLGWAAGSRSDWFEPDMLADDFNIAISAAIASGSPNFGVVLSNDRTNWFNHASFTGKTAAFDAAQTTPCKAMAFQFTAAGGVDIAIIQAGGFAR